MSKNNSKLELSNIHKSYGSKKLFNDFNISIKAGEFVTLLGPSGCGKSTLLRMIAGLEDLNKGKIKVANKDISDTPIQKRPIGMVFQSYALFPHMSVIKNISFGLKIQKLSKVEIKKKTDWIMSLLHLNGLENKIPRQLSGGERQRVALARSLVLEPEILLLDEPLSNLDAALREMAMEELKRIHQKVGKTIIYVTHNQMEAMVMSERIAVMKDGKLEQYAPPMELYDNPKTLFVAQFVGSPSANIFKGKIELNNGVATVDVALGKLLLPEIEDKDFWNKLDKKDVMVSIRPHDIISVEYSKEHHRHSKKTEVALNVELVETPGNSNLIICKTDTGESVRFFASRHSNYKYGDRCNVSIEVNKIHLFDIQSEESILYNRKKI